MIQLFSRIRASVFGHALMTQRRVDSDKTDEIKPREILPFILNGECTVMPDESDFVFDYFYCEWAYFWAGGEMITIFPFAKLTEDRMVRVEDDINEAMEEDRRGRNGEDDDEEKEEEAGEDDGEEEDVSRT